MFKILLLEFLFVVFAGGLGTYGLLVSFDMIRKPMPVQSLSMCIDERK